MSQHFFEVINQLAGVCHIPTLFDLNEFGIFYCSYVLGCIYITIISWLFFVVTSFCKPQQMVQVKFSDCPCHGSKFGADGSLQVGPSTKPLENFETKQEGDLILVKVA